MPIRPFIAAFCLILFAVAARPAKAEHDFQAEIPADETQETSRRATSILNVSPRGNSAPDVRTLRDIQEVIAATDPGTLEALKEALTEIAEGREVSGEAGQAAMDFLNRLPDPAGGEGEPAEVAEEPAPEPKAELPAVPNSERIKESGPASPGPAMLYGAAAPGAAIVKWEAPQTKLNAAQVPTIVRAAEMASSPGNLFRGFPYGPAKDAEGEGDEALGKPGEPSPADAREKRKARLAALGGVGGGELPTGQGEYSSGRSSGGGNGGTLTISTFTGVKARQEKQRLAGTVSSLLTRFKSRALATADKNAGMRTSLFERLARNGGLTPERALATAETSPVFRKFQAAATEVGMTPTESLGAYYTVLALAWTGTFVFLFYCLRHTPLLALIRRKKG